jgi:DNA-directed RNA polymerase specialized sigma24 family protein
MPNNVDADFKRRLEEALAAMPRNQRETFLVLYRNRPPQRHDSA